MNNNFVNPKKKNCLKECLSKNLKKDIIFSMDLNPENYMRHDIKSLINKLVQADLKNTNSSYNTKNNWNTLKNDSINNNIYKCKQQCYKSSQSGNMNPLNSYDNFKNVYFTDCDEKCERTEKSICIKMGSKHDRLPTPDGETQCMVPGKKYIIQFESQKEKKCRQITIKNWNYDVKAPDIPGRRDFNTGCLGRCGPGCEKHSILRFGKLRSNWNERCLVHDICGWYYNSRGGDKDKHCGDLFKWAKPAWSECRNIRYNWGRSRCRCNKQ